MVNTSGVLTELVEFAAKSFNSTPIWEDIIAVVLEKLGTVMRANWVSIFQNEIELSAIPISYLQFEWCADTTKSHVGDSRLTQIAHSGGFAQIASDLSHGNHFTGKETVFPVEIKDILGQIELGSLLLYPIMVDNKWWGFIGVNVPPKAPELDHDEVMAVSSIANILGTAIRWSRLERTRAAANQISEAAFEAQDLSSLYNSIHKIVDDLMPARNFYIALYDSATDLISFVYDVDEYDVGFPPQKSGHGLTEYVLRTGQPILATPQVFDELLARGDVDSVGTPSIDWLGVPLKSKEQTIGVLAVQSYTDAIRFSSQDMALLTFVSHQIAMAIERKLAEDRLKISEAQHRSFIENTPISMFRTIPGPPERFVMTNPAFLELFGYTSEQELVDCEMAAIFNDPGDGKDLTAALTSQGVIQSIELQLKRRDGGLIWGSVTGRVIRDEDGDILYLDFTVEDITERTKRAREREALISFATILRNRHTRSELISSILEYISILMEAASAVIAIVDQDKVIIKDGATRGYWAYLFDKELTFDEKLTRDVISSGVIFSNNSVKIDPLFLPAVHYQSVRAIVGLPLISENNPLGVIWLDREQAFSDEDLQLLGAICDMAANAIHRTTLHEQTNQRVQKLSSLRAIDTAISSTLDIRVVLSVLLDQLRTQLLVDAAAILLLKHPSSYLEYAAGRGFRTNSITQTRLIFGGSLIEKTILEHKAVRIDNLLENGDSYLRTRGLIGEQFEIYYAVPLIAKGQLVGVLELFNRSDINPDQEWLDFLDMLAGQAAIAIDNAALFNSLQRSNVELHLAYDTTLEAWSRALDRRMLEPEDQSQKLVHATILLARAMGLPDSELTCVRRGVLLHDIGNMIIPENILNKHAQLTDMELKVIHKHPDYARDLIWTIPYLRDAIDIPYCHHERWDGSGYPRGLKGEEIPLVARVFSVIDVWNAMGSSRPYREKYPEEQVVEYCKGQAGKQFDPTIVKKFIELYDSLKTN